MRITKHFLSLALTATAALAVAQSVTVSGQKVTFDAPPKMVNGTLMVPIKSMFDAMGANMTYKMDSNVIEGLLKGNKIQMWVGNKQAAVNDKRVDMDEPSYVDHGRTYAPLKFIAEGMHYSMSVRGGNFYLQEMSK